MDSWGRGGEGGLTPSASVRLWVSSKWEQLGNLWGSRKWRRAHSSLMLFCRGVPVTSSLFLKVHCDSSCSPAQPGLQTCPADCVYRPLLWRASSWAHISGHPQNMV